MVRREDIPWEELQRLNAQGWSYRRLAEKYGVSSSAIGRRAVREGWHGTNDQRANARLRNLAARLRRQAERRLAEELDATSAALLGPEVPPEAERGGTAEQLARIAEPLAVKNRRARRIWRIVAGVLIAFVMVNLLLILLNFAAFRSFQAEAESTVQAQELPRGES